MNRILFVILITLFSFVKGSAQISNAKDLLNFSKIEYNNKNKNLLENKWKQMSTKNYMDERGVSYSKTLYTKIYNGSEFRLFIEKAIYPDNNSTMLTTTLITTNGTSFDKLFEGIEKLGFIFKPIAKGKLFASSSDQKLLLASEIINIDKQTTDWIYQIKIKFNPN